MKKFLPSIVLLLLALALLAWVWMFNHLLKNERTMTKTREKEWTNTYLVSVGEKFEQELNQQLPKAAEVWNHTTNGKSTSPPYLETLLSGVRVRLDQTPSPNNPLDETAKDFLAQADSVDPDTFLNKLQTGTWKLGWVDDGRDVVASTALKLLGNAKGHTKTGHPKIQEQLAGHLWKCATNYTPPNMRPGFRLLILEELLNSSLLSHEQIAIARRIQAWETFQAVNGDQTSLPQPIQGKVIQYDERTKVFFLDSTISNMLERSSHGPKVEILDTKPKNTERISHRIQIGNNSSWLTLADNTNYLAPGYRQTHQVVMWLGAASGLLLVIGGTLAVWVARRDLRLARLRTDLAASVAHELRTPLAGQRLVLETLLSETPLSPDDQTQHNQQEYLTMAFKENQRLSQLAEEFLTFSRLERGILNLEPTAINTQDIIQASTEILQSKWNTSACTLTIDIPDELPPIRGDEQGLVTVLRNLLENAWKYTGEQKEIAISAREENQGVWIEVTDNGIGLNEKDQSRIFKQFYRVDHHLSQKQSGLGLGLAIVKRISEALDGKLRVDSTPGKGSTFGIWLPKYL